jgi:hypothetical protein
METDWSKVMEVFATGIIGVFVVMILLQILTQFSTRVIDFIENLDKGEGSSPEPKTPTATTKD